MKAYTDIEQSKKLAEFLPVESADSHYVRQTHDFRGNTVDGKWSHPKYGNPNSRYANYIVQNFSDYEILACWSLAALLEEIPEIITINLDDDESDYALEILKESDLYYLSYGNPLEAIKLNIEPQENFVDACVELIEKLHTENLI